MEIFRDFAFSSIVSIAMIKFSIFDFISQKLVPKKRIAF